MKMYKLIGWLLMPVLAACTSEVPSPEEKGLELTVQLTDTNEGLTTRAGRPLLSWAPAQDIQHITLYFVNKPDDGEAVKGIVLQKEIDWSQWQTAQDYAYGKQLKLKFQEPLPTGAYTLYAVGFSEPTDYTISPAPETLIDATTDNGLDESRIVPFDPEKDFYSILNTRADAEEIFAGKAEVHVTQVPESDPVLALEGGGSAVVTLNRQVAGMIGYFTNIPVKVLDIVPTRIRLVASNKNDKVWHTELRVGETVTGNTISWVINGSQSKDLAEDAAFFATSGYGNDAYEVYSIDLAEWFPYAKPTGTESSRDFASCDIDKDGYVGYKDAQAWVYGQASSAGIDLTDWSEAIKGEKEGNKKLEEFWVNPNTTDQCPQQLVAGSVFAGRFVIPFAAQTGKETLELQLLGNNTAGKEVILKSWRVKVSANGKYKPSIDPDEEVATGTIIPMGDEDYIYNVYRNHLYSIGKKQEDGQGNPKPAPDEKADNPEDLNKSQELQINVQPNWRYVYNMDI